MKICIFGSFGGIGKMLPKKSIFSFCALLFSLLLFTSMSYTQQICIPEAKGVPGTTWDKPPNWWDSSETYVYSTDLDDPQWRGTFMQNFPIGGAGGAIEDVSFRALHKNVGGNEYLYLSWHAKVVPAAIPNYNKLFVGFRDPSSSGNDVVIVVTPTTISNATATTQYDLKVLKNLPSGWITVQNKPEWLTDTTRVWVTASTNEWAVQMRIKTTTTSTNLNNGINIGSNFRMWYEIRVAAPTETNGYTPYTWPYEVEADPILDTPPPPTIGGDEIWSEFRLITGMPDSSCSAVGVSIRKEDIGTLNPNPREINFNSINTFFARPTNQSGHSVSGIKARFRIANWGVQPIWEAGVPVDELWDDIADANGVPSGGITIADGAQGNITIPWTLALREKCLFEDYYNSHVAQCDEEDPNLPAEKRWRHQCLLVELLGGGGVTFINQSVYNNMNFVGASKFEQDAEIKIKGLPANPLGGNERDVYLYVQALNMSEFVKEKAEFVLSDKIFGGIVSVPAQYLRENDFNNQAVNEEMSYEKLAKEMPTYQVHAYYDTGRRKSINGVDHPILRPMTSFGYFINHEGDLEGWKHALRGVKLMKIAPNFYKIAVPNDGVATVTTTIKALDPKFAISARLGWDIPHGTFATMVNSGLSLNAGIEYLLNRYLSIEAIFGYHHFADNSLGTDQKIYQFSGNVRYFYPLSLRLRSFIIAGAGMYSLEPGNSDFGYNAGAGIDLYLTNQLALEAVYNFHNISNVNYRFSTLQLGFRYRF